VRQTIELPHPSTGVYSGGRITSQVFMGFGAYVTVCGAILAGREVAHLEIPLAGLALGVMGLGIGVLARDTYIVGKNLEDFHKKSFIPVQSSKDVTKAAIKGTFLKKTYYDLASCVTGDFQNVQVSLGKRS
jgi:hypothetical protein